MHTKGLPAMKRMLISLLLITMLLCLWGCGKTVRAPKPESTPAATEVLSVPATQTSLQTEEPTLPPTEEVTQPSTEESTEPATEEVTEPPTEGGRVGR